MNSRPKLQIRRTEQQQKTTTPFLNGAVAIYLFASASFTSFSYFRSASFFARSNSSGV
jgi:hypothetical protein